MKLPYNISLILAYKEDNAERAKNLELFKDYYSRMLPYSELIIEETNSDVFNKCELYNRGAAKARYNTLCFIDSDIFVSESSIELAFKHAQNDSVVIGYSGDAVYMSYKFKDTIEKGFTYSDLVKVVQPYNTLRVGIRTDMYWVGHTNSPGGCLMMTKECFKDIGGFNPNFKNWGYEDDEILCRSHLLKKNVIRLQKSQSNILIHLPHVQDGEDRSQHEYYESNHQICKDVKGKTYDELKEYIATWNVDSGERLQDISLRDNNFVGDSCTCRGQVPTSFNWCRYDVPNSKSTFFTDSAVSEIDQYTGANQKVAWLLEPRAIYPRVYEFIENNYHKFDYILTYDDKLLSLDADKFLPYKWGNCWVEGYVDYDIVQNKTKLVSTIASSKRWTQGQKLRHDIIQGLSLVKNKDVDVYGSDYTPLPKLFRDAPWAEKVTALQDYMFSITIENSQQDTYFTEKIIDCFATKTVPIYWGTKKITQYFDGDGIIFFDTVDELKDILDNLTEERYKSMLSAVESNYKRYVDYIIPEDYIYRKYQFLFK